MDSKTVQTFSYGTNGYRLEFKQTGLGSGSSSKIGADTSGNKIIMIQVV